MDLSTLPLMPSMDLPPPVEVLVPTAQRPSFDASTKRLPEREVLDGCFCPSCQEQRERDRTASSMRQQYGSATPPTSRFVTASIAAQYDGDIYASVADAFSGAVTRRISASQPAMVNLPRAAPPVQSTQRIRGRYTRDTDVNGTLAGDVRWLDPADGCLYDNLTDMSSVNSGMTPRVDGTWANDTGRVWEAT